MRKLFVGFILLNGLMQAQAPSVCFDVIKNNGPAVGDEPYTVITADFNNDGKADVATANFLSNNVSVGHKQQLQCYRHQLTGLYQLKHGSELRYGKSKSHDYG